MAEDLYKDFDKDLAFHLKCVLDTDLNFDEDMEFYHEEPEREREETMKRDMQHSSSKPLLQYHLFVYREELRRRKMNRLHLTKTKIDLTGGLLINCEGKICDFSPQDINAFVRQVDFKDRLVRQHASLYADIDEAVERDVDGKLILKCNVKCYQSSKFVAATAAYASTAGAGAAAEKKEKAKKEESEPDEDDDMGFGRFD
ncbi:uncharacterized protein LOC120778359 [Bactrocera tryoni]|uniref:uncharacterized protein LOC120778359 n=1 Tax=Bactrocera tryoni TaxID=59916 RepID=UPI001A9814AD|nr:uncharacterized protein LOC120778359 [Bactrocera tryoni]